MKPDQSVDPRPFSATDGEELDPDQAGGPKSGVSTEIPFPAPSDSGTRGYAVEIFGDERGGQTPKLPPRPLGNQDE